MATKTTKENTESTKAIASPEAKKPKSKGGGKWLKWIAVLLLIVIGLYALRKYFIVATVDGKPITRLEVIQELEKQGGAQVFEQIVTRKLIFQAAADANIIISDEDIDSEIEKLKGNIESQGLTYEEALKYQGLTEEGLRTNIRIQKTMEALLADKISVSDDEVKAYYEENKELFAADATFESLKQGIMDQLAQEKMQTEYQAFIDRLRSKASIIQNIQY